MPNLLGSTEQLSGHDEFNFIEATGTRDNGSNIFLPGTADEELGEKPFGARTPQVKGSSLRSLDSPNADRCHMTLNSSSLGRSHWSCT